MQLHVFGISQMMYIWTRLTWSAGSTPSPSGWRRARARTAKPTGGWMHRAAPEHLLSVFSAIERLTRFAPPCTKSCTRGCLCQHKTCKYVRWKCPPPQTHPAARLFGLPRWRRRKEQCPVCLAGGRRTRRCCINQRSRPRATTRAQGGPSQLTLRFRATGGGENRACSHSNWRPRQQCCRLPSRRRPT